MRMCKRSSSTDTWVNGEERAGGVLGARAEIPLQPMEIHGDAEIPLQPMEIHGDAEIPLQPMEIHGMQRFPLQPMEDPNWRRGMAKKGCDAIGSPSWNREAHTGKT
ncbi:hypothetical protein DUI87_30744 [Hirundo rustica rustica]|uniref:Uncharacterized protein n=1 Tax=Hirundo rustica rustica TaxID=333673 RepID=A0A3M0IY17_HIRRU|nr:hypothetical protein DUI87_30744 [Hirundo rustica rustica]